ncbi:MAG: ASKHA domain-containing protein [Halocynthiibacter sp.]
MTARDVKASRAALLDILTGISENADRQARDRCPYRDKNDHCTAKFSCQNQRLEPSDSNIATCGHDGPFGYQVAWESKPRLFDKAKSDIAAIKLRSAARRSGRSDPDAKPTTVFELAENRGVKLASSCRQLGECHECIVDIRHGGDALSPRTTEESFLSGSFRLACQAGIVGLNREIDFIPLHRRAKVLTKSSTRNIDLKPAVWREGNDVICLGRRIDQYHGNLFGLAIDLGTTTIVIELLNLETGATLASGAMENPQKFGGSDVMSRISYDNGSYQGELRKAVVNSLNREITAICRSAKASAARIYEIVVVGNSTMRDLFFGLDVQGLGQKPYRSSIERRFRDGELVNTWLQRPARELGVRAHHRAVVTGLPLIGSHVGADTAALVAALEISADDIDVSMVVDIGTNTEIVIAGRGKMFAASSPAGPAFEGGLVKFGMPGQNGAIEKIRISDDRTFEFSTIGDEPAVGICGSGLIDLLAELRASGMMTEKGVLKQDRRAFEAVIDPVQGITFSAEDASHLAQAKAASFCGQALLLKTFGITPAEISHLYLAGGFANYIDVDNAQAIGFVAPVARERVIKVGNAALQGARELLLNTDRREALTTCIVDIEHIELETSPEFFDLFVEGCQFKPMPDDMGQSVNDAPTLDDQRIRR